MNKSLSNAKISMNMGTLRKVSHEPNNPSHKNRTRTNGNNQKGKKLMGRMLIQIPHKAREKNPQLHEIDPQAPPRKEIPSTIDLLGSKIQKKIMKLIGTNRKEMKRGDKNKQKKKIEKEKRKKF
jgi:hypothetical protein